MAVKRTGLGRNLSALLGTASSESKLLSEQTMLALHDLRPGKYQPRSVIEEDALQELADSIKQQGLLQPIVVRPLIPDHYEIIAGERRWRACQLAGLTEVPVLIRRVDDETAVALALIENLQREDLNPLDQARSMARLTEEFGLTHQQVADLLSKSRAAVSNFLRLLSLSADVMVFLERGDLDMGHARALLSLEKDKQLEVAKLIIAKNLTVREAEKLIHRVKEDKPLKLVPPEMPTIFNAPLQNLQKFLNTRVSVKHQKNGKGSLIIHFNSSHDLVAVIDQIIS